MLYARSSAFLAVTWRSQARNPVARGRRIVHTAHRPRAAASGTSPLVILLSPYERMGAPKSVGVPSFVRNSLEPPVS